jgi:hypothetical protein
MGGAEESSLSVSLAKRKRDDDNDGQSFKRVRIPSENVDRLSRLSDELILRVFSCLPISDLNTCQRYAIPVKNLNRGGS